MTNTTQSPSPWKELNETSPGANATASPVNGWVVSTLTTGSSALDSDTERASTTFNNTVPIAPNGILTASVGDALRTALTYTGSFAAGTWEFHATVIATTVGGAQDGKMCVRMFKSPNADGSSATQLIGRIEGGTVLNVGTTTPLTSTASFSPGQILMHNEYLFVQPGWQITGAGGMSTSDINLRIGTTATKLVSTDFTDGTPPASSFDPFGQFGIFGI